MFEVAGVSASWADGEEFLRTISEAAAHAGASTKLAAAAGSCIQEAAAV